MGAAGRSPDAVRIRPYREGDLEALRSITVDCFTGVSIDWMIEQRYGEIGGSGWGWRKARHIDADVAANAEGVFVAELGGKTVGYVTSRLDHAARIGWIPNLAVHADFQRRGIATRLLDTCIAYLRASGMLFAKIETLAHNDAGATLYPRMGFQEVCRQVHYVRPL